MSAEVDTMSTTTKAQPQATHADMFFRYVAALCQVAGVQAFTMAVAVPKEDGTSAVMSIAAGPPQATDEWRQEVSKLLADSASTAAATMLKAPAEESTKAPEVV